jgi:hypothetical protein
LARKISEGSFNGELKIDLAEMAKQIRGNDFYVYLFLEGGYGAITSYAVDGTSVK